MGSCVPNTCVCPPPALWEATRVLMLLSVLTATAGLALGLSIVASAARRARARMAGVTLLLAGTWGWDGGAGLGHTELRDCPQGSHCCIELCPVSACPAGGSQAGLARAADPSPLPAGLLALLGLGVYTAGTLSLLGPARTAWRFSWSYILGWVAVVLIGSAGSSARRVWSLLC